MRKNPTMKCIKDNWPVLLMLAASVYCIYEWVTNASSDAGGVIVFFIVCFGIIMPICSLVVALWYGYRLRSRFKWLIAFACCIPCIVIRMISSGIHKLLEALFFVPVTLIAAIVGIFAGSAVWNMKHKQIEDQSSKGRNDL